MSISSPCIKVCVMDPASGICVGCGRTLDEIARWSSMTDAERAEIMSALPDRAPSGAHHVAAIPDAGLKDRGPKEQ